MPKAHYKFTGVGKRKTAIARVYMNPGSGTIAVNHRPIEEYFPTRMLQTTATRALEVSGNQSKYDIYARVVGGGVNGQAEAVDFGLAQALLQADPELKSKLKIAGFLTRDSRKKERKKYGQPGARKRFQYSKR